MTISPPFKLAAAAAAFSLMTAFAPAQAAVIGSFDPAFSDPTATDGTANLGFKGTITMDVSQGCYDEAAANYGFASTGSEGCTIGVEGVTLDFYNSSLNPTGSEALALAQGSLYQVQMLDPSYFPDYVYAALIDSNNNFQGIATNNSNPFLVSVSDSSSTFPINYNGYMELYFTAPVSDPAYLIACPSPNGQQGACTDPGSDQYFSTSSTSNPAISVTFTNTDVPEPATLPLTLLGLAGLAAARRRRRAASTERPIDI